MTNQKNYFDSAAGDFEKDVAPTNVQSSKLTVRTNFAPWHKPRKQFLRKQQWAESVRKLVERLELKNGDSPLRYLSLPGPDLLDVRSIQPIFADAGVNLQFVGLNAGDDDIDLALRAILLNQVRSLPGIDVDSDVVPDRFEALAQHESIAYSRIIGDSRTYDVINIDLCGSAAEAPPKQVNSVIAALYALLVHQAQNRRRDWLFFITTRSSSEKVDEQFLRRLLEAINEIMRGRPVIKDYLLENKILKKEEFDDNELQYALLSSASHSNAFAVGLSFWVLRALLQSDPAWRADMLPHYEYHVNMTDASCDMLSMGFYCKCIAVAKDDDFGLAAFKGKPDPDRKLIQENCQDKITRRLKEREDIDIRLHLSDVEYEMYLQESAKLLQGAFYDVSAYYDWAKERYAEMKGYLEGHQLLT